MERYRSIGQSPQRAVARMEEEEDDGAYSRPKHVEKRNKHTKENCAPSWFYLKDYRLRKLNCQCQFILSHMKFQKTPNKSCKEEQSQNLYPYV